MESEEAGHDIGFCNNVAPLMVTKWFLLGGIAIECPIPLASIGAVIESNRSSNRNEPVHSYQLHL